MKAVLQRVSSAGITIDGIPGGTIGTGMVVLVGVMKGDTEKEAEQLADKIAGLRIFTDENDKMNLSLGDVGGDLLVVSNFTLGANCRKGRRPSFEGSMLPIEAERLYESFVGALDRRTGRPAVTGKFGADMQIELVNDGPVTIILDTDELKRRDG